MTIKNLRLLPLVAVIVALIMTVLADPVRAINPEGTLQKWDGFGTNSVVTKSWFFNLPPSFPSTDSTFVIVPVGVHMRPLADGDDGNHNFGFMLGWNATAASESLDTQIFVGPTAKGPWTSVSAAAKENVGGLSGTAPFDVVQGVSGIATTFSLMPYWMVLLKGKGSTVVSKQFYILLLKGPGY